MNNDRNARYKRRKRRKIIRRFVVIGGIVLVVALPFYRVVSEDKTQEVSSEESNEVSDIVDNKLDKPKDDIDKVGNKGINSDNKDKKEEKISLKDTVEIDNNGNKIIKDPNDVLVLANKERELSSDYIPKDLIIPNVRFPFEENLPKKQMREVAAKALEKLFDAANKETIHLFATSGYRSYDRQKNLFNYYTKQHGEEAANKFSAKPGQSEHQTGLAMDVTSQSVGFNLTEDFGQVVEGKWLKENAHRFGFIIRYPKGKEGITGYQYEPWHIRYVGKEVAKDIYENNLTLEEYYKEY
ncbi:M15 family metallopeptidase [Dethiothermospora halolimnae]|uniref:M15 family metallopeptidase n=1 Tax=Dethiothermospora halolimnae TaxID=3114390 RepID=UPI003CCBE75C